MNKKGFTLIELLVVIAIIGILASVVLASLNSARAKGADAAIKSGLANARAQAELYYDANNNSYSGVCTVSGGISTMIAGAASAYGATVVVSTSTVQAAGTAVCHDGGAGWAASVPLKTSNGASYWCVDNAGKSASTSAVLAVVSTPGTWVTPTNNCQ
jgi:prepilin-type N-terminal cleavage/methylation domain-containing protein